MSSTSSVTAIANTPSLNTSTRPLSHRGSAVALPASAAPRSRVTLSAAAIDGGGGHDGQGDEQAEGGDPGQPKLVVDLDRVCEEAGRDRDRKGDSGGADRLP